MVASDFRTTNTDGQSYNNGTIENHDFTRGSKYEQRIHENGIHKTQVGSIRDIDDTDGRMKTYQRVNTAIWGCLFCFKYLFVVMLDGLSYGHGSTTLMMVI
jgi:hypothetical protein